MSLTKQCRLLNLSRSGIYYTPVPVSDKDRVLNVRKQGMIILSNLTTKYEGKRSVLRRALRKMNLPAARNEASFGEFTLRD